jgi:hypothetical protein
MAVFLFKVVSIAVRTLARPLINWLSYYNRIKMQESKNIFAIFMKNKLIFLGQNFHYYNVLLNRKIFGLSKESVIKPLTEDKALERGAELISEMIVYSILLIVPSYEMIKSYKTTQQKNQKKKDYMVKIQTEVESMIELNLKNSSQVKEIKNSLIKINEGIYLV